MRDSLVTQGLCYPLTAPLLLPGTADTLIDANFDERLPRALIHHKRYNNRASVHEHTYRHVISPPSASQAGSLRRVPGAPDSLCLVLTLAPGDSLLVARRQTNYFFNETGALLATDGEKVPYAPPYRPMDATPLYREPYEGATLHLTARPLCGCSGSMAGAACGSNARRWWLCCGCPKL